MNSLVAIRCRKLLLAMGILLTGARGHAAPEVAPREKATLPGAENGPSEKNSESRPWYETFRLRGYTQIRYNRFPSFDFNDDLVNDQGDKSIGGGSGAFIRRARLILFGDVSDHVSFYLQPDFASSISEQNHVTILRDWYFDIFFDSQKEFRVRVGQSKVPFGFENMQSSQNRLPLDRNDALNSAARDERDLGAFFYFAPASVRARFKYLVDSGLKGSGDYGMVGLGVYNGQGANRFDRNDNLHVIARVTYPFEIGNQIVEVGGGGYRGRFLVSLAERDGVTFTTTRSDNNMLDARAHAAFVLYPQPFGIQAEYNVGVGPEQRRDAPTVIDQRRLHGGYATLSYKIDEPFGTRALIPYVRGLTYDGGKKFETNATRYRVREVEMGVEWQIWKALEITGVYTFSDRTAPTFPLQQQKGQLTRLQVQVNY